MTEFLVKHFVKDSDNVSDPGVRTGYGSLASIVGIICNLILCAMKIFIGIVSNSVSIIADGVNNLSDASSSVITLLGFIISKKPADEKHPYGHARVEYLSGLAVAALIIVIGVELATSSFNKILNPEQVEFSAVLVIILLASIAVKTWMSLFNNKLGKVINSTSILATAADSRNDAITTSAVLLAAVISKISGFNLDGIIGLIVALFILWSGFGIARDTISPLLGESADPELIKLIHDQMLSFDKRILGIHDLMVHDYGPGQQFATVHAEINANEDVIEAHEMIDNAERMFKEKYHILLTVHYDPVIMNNPEQNKLRDKTNEIIKEIDERLKLHDFRIVSGKGHTNIVFDLVMPSDFTGREDEMKQRIEEKLNADNRDMKYYTVITFDSENFNMI